MSIGGSICTRHNIEQICIYRHTYCVHASVFALKGLINEWMDGLGGWMALLSCTAYELCLGKVMTRHDHKAIIMDNHVYDEVGGRAPEGG